MIDAQIVSGTCSGRRVFIPRIQLTSPDSDLPFTLRRRLSTVSNTTLLLHDDEQGAVTDIGVRRSIPANAYL